jgi:RNA polymerase primary sigma factor
MNLKNDEENNPKPNLEKKQPNIEFNSEHLEQILNRIGSRAFEILILRFGVGGNKRLTLQEIGNIHALTRERVRQIQEVALSKLRHPSFSVVSIKITLINADHQLRSGGTYF